MPVHSSPPGKSAPGCPRPPTTRQNVKVTNYYVPLRHCRWPGGCWSRWIAHTSSPAQLGRADDQPHPRTDRHPAVVIDHDVLERNIARMNTAITERGIALRPHVKTHKVPEIAQMQLAAGAAGLTVATIGEAEVFAAHGADDIFIAYPLWLGSRQADRLRRLTSRARVAIGLDSPEAAMNVAAMLGRDRAAIEVLIEVDSGHHRSGVAAQQVGEIAAVAKTSDFASLESSPSRDIVTPRASPQKPPNRSSAPQRGR